jgi:(1->4)-alpha-D-glucan 1-alpha-D-glucosylmutase
MGLLVDMVPNHMGNDCSNKWWMDLLEKGTGSNYAWWFDIDWKPANPTTHGKVLLAILEDHYWRVLETGKLKLVFEDERFWIRYHERRFPLTPQASRSLKQRGAMRSIEQLLKEMNGRPGEPRSFQNLHSLLRHQHYRFAFWRLGSEELNYRRFFDVTELVSMRVELPEVFDGTHELLFRFIQQGFVTGLRIDHPDGLWDPKKYLERLQEKFQGMIEPDRPAQPTTSGSGKPPLYVVVEKILTGPEQLPADWPVYGTTGYDFLNKINGLFVDARNEEAFSRIYRDFTGNKRSFAETAYDGKWLVLEKSLVSEVASATNRLKQIAAQTRYGQDLSTRQLQSALMETIACFPVYRTYVGDESGPSATDRQRVHQAISAAKGRNAEIDLEAFDFLQKVLLLDAPPDATAETEGKIREFVLKFQQLTGPATAKGVEDTAFYNFNRFVSLNEVGGEPGQFGTSLQGFHDYNSTTLKQWPGTLLATATHDTKRGEDVRARLSVLSEMPKEWSDTVNRWRSLNRFAKTENGAIPSENDEYLFYQTLVGAWLPGANSMTGLGQLRERLAAYMLKAIRESKAHTSWTRPNAAYEEGVKQFVERVLSNPESEFLSDFRRFHEPIAYFGHLNSLAQTLLKLTSPGVPDIYQGTELWDLSLVDPDNRRGVDYRTRRKMLREIKDACSSGGVPETALKSIRETWSEGCVKLFLLWRVLNFRRENEKLFKEGEYLPLSVEGEKAEHICAFARTNGSEAAIVAVPRLSYSLCGGDPRRSDAGAVWANTRLKIKLGGTLASAQNAITGEQVAIENQKVSVACLLKTFPVALVHCTLSA